MIGCRLDVRTLSSRMVSNSFCVEACSIMESGVDRTMCSAVVVDDFRDCDKDNGELAKDCTLAILADVEKDWFGFDCMNFDRVATLLFWVDVAPRVDA